MIPYSWSNNTPRLPAGTADSVAEGSPLMELNTFVNVAGRARTFSTNGALSATDTMANRAAALDRLMTGA